MATLSSIQNLVACGAGSVLGTGTKGCKPFFKKVAAIWLVPSGFVFDGTQTLDATYVQLLQAQGNLIVLSGVETFADNTPDDVVEELESGTKSYVRDAKYEFRAQFINGFYFHSALHFLSSQGSYDTLFVDVDGNILGSESTSGNLKGFTTGMLQADKMTWGTDSTAQREGLMFQFTKRNELDKSYVYISNGQLTFEPANLDGINEIVVDISVPADSGTTLTAVCKRKQDSEPFTGALYTDFLFQADGVTQNPTGGDDSVTPGTYLLTGFTAWSTGEVVTGQLYDNSNSRSVINLSAILYKSNTDSEVAV